MEEQWKPITGYEGLYEVSNLGNVRSLDRRTRAKNNSTMLRKGCILIPFYEEKKGYYQVTLNKDGKKKHHRVHRLVASAFLENPFNYTDVNHKDENKTNNHVDNLEWCTRKYNNNYGTKPERIRQTMINRYKKIKQIRGEGVNEKENR